MKTEDTNTKLSLDELLIKLNKEKLKEQENRAALKENIKFYNEKIKQLCSI
jgi:hypothetical protein